MHADADLHTAVAAESSYCTRQLSCYCMARYLCFDALSTACCPIGLTSKRWSTTCQHQSAGRRQTL